MLTDLAKMARIHRFCLAKPLFIRQWLDGYLNHNWKPESLVDVPRSA